MAAKKCAWLMLPDMLSVTSTRSTKELTHSSCFVDVMRSHESYVHPDRDLSALVTLEWVQELCFCLELSHHEPSVCVWQVLVAMFEALCLLILRCSEEACILNCDMLACGFELCLRLRSAYGFALAASWMSLLPSCCFYGAPSTVGRVASLLPALGSPASCLRALGVNPSCGICAMWAEVTTTFSFLAWSTTMAAKKCAWLMLSGMLSVISTRPTKELTHSSCSVDVMRNHASYVHHDRDLSALVILEWVKELCFCLEPFCSSDATVHHTSGKLPQEGVTHDWWNVPFILGWHGISCIPIGTVISPDTVSAGNVVHHDLSPPTKGFNAGLQGTLRRD